MCIILCNILILSCIADEDDCTYWKCKDYKSTTDFNEYRNCSLNSSYWMNGDIYNCKYCQIVDGGVCWCSSKHDCEETSLLIFGVAMMILSLLCTAIIWYKYIAKYRQMMRAKTLLLQKEKRRNRNKKRRSKSKQSKSMISQHHSRTQTGDGSIDDGEEDGEYSSNHDTFSSDPYSSEDIQDVSNVVHTNFITIQSEINDVGRYNIKCFCVWTVTIICCIVFITGLGIIIYGL